MAIGVIFMDFIDFIKTNFDKLETEHYFIMAVIVSTIGMFLFKIFNHIYRERLDSYKDIINLKTEKTDIETGIMKLKIEHLIDELKNSKSDILRKDQKMKNTLATLKKINKDYKSQNQISKINKEMEMTLINFLLSSISIVRISLDRISLSKSLLFLYTNLNISRETLDAPRPDSIYHSICEIEKDLKEKSSFLFEIDTYSLEAGIIEKTKQIDTKENDLDRIINTMLFWLDKQS